MDLNLGGRTAVVTGADRAWLGISPVFRDAGRELEATGASSVLADLSTADGATRPADSMADCAMALTFSSKTSVVAPGGHHEFLAQVPAMLGLVTGRPG